MKQTEYDLLKMRHARCVARIYQYAAHANREAALDGWLFDWSAAMRDANIEAVAIENEIACALHGLMPEEVLQSERDYREAATPST